MNLDRGQLFLGTDVDSNESVIYDSDDLTTHGVIVGMTGSGKTGLGVGLVEEALLNGISCLIIDPKGDMGNLALVFPDLAPADFEPWVDEALARREGKTVAESAEETANLWRSGLEGDGIGPERMKRLRESAEVTIYTPGSGAGVGMNVLGSLRAPTLDWSSEAEVIRDEISSFVSSLLVLAGVRSDPVSGQEHILLATLIEHHWKEGRDLDLATLVSQLPKPPFRKLGVFDIDDFFPERGRMELALKLNGLLASPSFAAWMQGPPLDIEELIGGDSTKAAIIYMSHLSDEERQFLVTLVLSKTVSWIRSQPGTSELRKLIYMDEVFGFAPPTREPPSKRPILTILKQARAHGVGMVLSTQNPVDLDYMAMSNAGTWMVGRLQTENDKRRILEGLSSASGEVDIKHLDRQISDLEKRRFVLHSTKRPHPRIFGTRWAMSYLAGPLTRDQVSTLTEDHRGEGESTKPASSTLPQLEADDLVTVPPKVADGIPVSFLDPGAPWAEEIGADPTGTVYEPAAVAKVQLTYTHSKADLHHRETYEAVVYPLDGVVDPEEVFAVDHDDRDFLNDPADNARFQLPEVPIHTKTFWNSVSRDLRDHLVADRTLEIRVNTDLDIYSRIDETEEHFLERVRLAAEQASDQEMARLKDRFQTRIDRLQSEIQAALTRYQEADAVAAARSQETLVGTAGDLLGSFLGGRSTATALNRAARRRTAQSTARARSDTAATRYHNKLAELEQLENELADQVDATVSKYSDLAANVETLEVRLTKTNTRVVDVRAVWVPVS